jgi:hypothetical protein
MMRKAMRGGRRAVDGPARAVLRSGGKELQLPWDQQGWCHRLESLCPSNKSIMLLLLTPFMLMINDYDANFGYLEHAHVIQA